PPRQPEGKRDADQERQHRRRRPDLQAAPGGIDPGRIVEISRIPFQREARRRKAQVTARTERDRKQHDQRQDQERKDQPADGAQQYPPCPGTALLSLSRHCRPLHRIGQSLRWRATPWFSSQNITSVTASRITDSAPAKFHARNSRTCCSITIAYIIT